MQTPYAVPRTAIALLAALLAVSSVGGEGAGSVEEARALLMQGRAEEAAATFAGALAKDPRNVDAMAGRVRALIRDDQWHQALEEARGFHARVPDTGIAGALAEALVRAGRLTEARTLLEPLVAEEDVGGRMLGTYGRVLAAEGRGEADSYATQAVEAAPEDRDVLLWASEITGIRERTIELLRRYLELAEGDDADRGAAAAETLQFLEGIGDRQFWVPRQRPERVELPLRPVPGAGRAAGYTIEVAGGPKAKKVRLLLDTGSTGLFLVERAARRLGLVALDEQTVFGGGGDQRHSTQRGVLPDVAFGDLQFADALVSTSKQSIHPTGAYNGVISLAAFEGYRVTIDTGARRLILDAAPESPRGVPYWVVSGQWLIEAGAGNATGLFLLDTGAHSSVVAASLAPHIDEARLGGPAGAAGFGGARSGARWLHGARVQFLERSTPARPLHVLDLALRSRLGGVELSGFVGLDILDGTRLILDTTRRRVAVEESGKR